MKTLAGRLVYLSTILLLLCNCNSDKFVRDYTPRANFEALWQIIDTKYCYLNEKQIDWQNVKSLFEPKLRDVHTEYELFDLLAAMLDTLQDGHVNLYSSFDISRCRGWFSNYPANFSNDLIYSDRYLGTNYRITGGMAYKRIADGRVGYIRYASFADAISSVGMRYIENQFKNCKGIIIDVRNNGGGRVDYAASLAACFFSSRTLTGYMRHKTGNGHNDFSAPEAVYTNPADAYVDWSHRGVVVLCNRRSYSATNDFVARVQYAPHVLIIGGVTGGGGGMPLSSELPCGWMVRFSAIPMYNAAMQTTEFGIVPNVEVQLDSTDAANGYDTLIERAVAAIETNS